MDKTGRLKIIVKGVFTAYLITLILLFIYSIILCYTELPESTIPTCIFVIGIVSVFIASSMYVTKLKENGIKNGGMIGFIYILIIYLVSSIASMDFSITSYAISTIIFNILLGMIGRNSGSKFGKINSKRV